MPVEMAAITFDGTHTAASELSNVRASRVDQWLDEVAVLEHHHSGRYSMKATSPDYGDRDHVGAGIAIGGGTGLLLGLIGGPLGLVFWSGIGAMLGGVAGAASSSDHRGTFDPLVDKVKVALPEGTSALILVADTPTAEEFIGAVRARNQQIIRHQLTEEQVEQLTQVAIRK